MRMNDFDGKQFLADVRRSDFAHAGEVESIKLMFATTPVKEDRRVLDAGCGRGGTADYVHRNGFGQVVGIDIESQSIEYAKKQYPNVEFEVCDICDAGSKYPRAFELIYMFNAFYAVENKAAAMASLRKASKKEGLLYIFDYVTLKPEQTMPEVMLSQKPATMSEFRTLLKDSSFELTEARTLDREYIAWYRKFLTQFDSDLLKEKYPQKKIDEVREKYAGLLKAHEDGVFGGALIKAVAI